MIHTEERPGRTSETKPEVLCFRLEELMHRFEKAGDRSVVKKAVQLLEKLRNKEITVTFCGHFSAGKSSMINALLGSEVLPSSPIPTSANVVQIKTGKKGAKIYLKSGKEILFGPDYDLSELKKYAVNGEEVESIELFHPSNLLNVPLTIMDTPGIDSTDDAHKVATESSLHLADIVLYVMDYNHVQSEVNFQFTKTLKDREKTVFLVINQIDKHVDFELSFADYRKSVIEAFKHWDIHPDGIYFTSLKDAAHIENQWPNLLRKLTDIAAEKDEWLTKSILSSSLYLIEQHHKFLQSKHEQERENCEQALAGYPPADILSRYNDLSRQLEEIMGPVTRMEAAAKAELQTILDNAPLIPFATRELARLFLESRQSGFKVGFLFSSGKTKEEQQRRLQALFSDIQEKAFAHLEWHIKEMLRQVPEKYGYDSPAYQQQVMDFQVSFLPELLIDAVKPGAMNNGEYVLNYSKDVAEKIKGLYRRAALDLLKQAVLSLRSKLSDQSRAIEQQMKEMKELRQASERLMKLEESETQAIASLERVMMKGVPGEENARPLAPQDQPVVKPVEWNETAIPITPGPNRPVELTRREDGEGKSRQANGQFSSAMQKDYKGQLLHTANILRESAARIDGIPGLSAAGRSMVQRAERLEQNRFTVALFGAFSAGKSSFANALLGDYILPVSPNPTTAAINKIVPPDEENPHGTVRVRLKTREDISSDVVASLEIFDLTAQTVEEGMEFVNDLDPADIHPAAKPHYSFLRAVKKGYADIQDRLGTDILIGLKEFQEFVAHEEKACFVEWIELYYDCPLTRQGIILVDTPGADSINARHTGVAFEYIKNADAILFVTYYNHAFSHADREFLIQLGRVKDTFAMDKMFFIVNAADLARSEEELDGVVRHVKENLESCRIVNPRIYSVSSQTALLARMAEAGTLSASSEQIYRKRLGLTPDQPLPDIEQALRVAGLRIFEEEFIAFTLEELTQIAITSSLEELSRTTDTLQDLIIRARQDENTRKSEYVRAKQERARCLEVIDRLDTRVEVELLQKEIMELTYYVKQRVMLRFSEAFRYSFNPATLKSDSQNLQKLLLGSLDELSRFLSFDLSQEMRATALRIENFMHKAGNHVLEKLNKKLAVEDFKLRQWEKSTYDTPEFPGRFPEQTTRELAGPLRLFKNPKQFFEQGGQEKMKEQLEQLYQLPVDEYVEQGQTVLLAYYVQAFEQQMFGQKERAGKEVAEHFAGQLAALSEDIDVEQLMEVRKTLDNLLQNAQKIDC
ncbi:dynamin family protein [Aneurinibacillus terranovensis]|uniref:dynamin family protein n=1 Tax=Aneurinibacillus terranovensis TaxID=278991 RepID=UPI00042662DB|nr:dynamin family protein [Aneurinibacillus terranovensis]